MRNGFMIAYDVADDKRLRKTHKKMLGFGDPLQYSVFYCELSPTERQLLKQELWAILDFTMDRIMLVDLGPANGRAEDCIEFWGKPRHEQERQCAIIV